MDRPSYFIRRCHIQKIIPGMEAFMCEEVGVFSKEKRHKNSFYYAVKQRID